MNKFKGRNDSEFYTQTSKTNTTNTTNIQIWTGL